MKKTFFLASLISCLLFFLSLSCAYSGDEYIIGPDDALDISVINDATLTKTYLVDKDGSIQMPYLNQTKVSGLTAAGAAESIAGGLKAGGFILDPAVNVTIKDYRSQKVLIFGKVKKPGAYFLKGKTTVLDLLTQLEDTEGEGGKMTILRKKPSGEDSEIVVDLNALVLNGDLSQNVEVLGGDKVVITRFSTPGMQVYALGEVKTPGSYTIDQGSAVLDALKAAGGVTETADKSAIKIIRRIGDQENEFVINLDKVSEGDISQNIELVSQDRVVVIRKVTTQQMIYVLGEVKQPGPYNIEKELTALEAFYLAGGFTDFANKGKAKVIREEADGTKTIIIINLNKIKNGDKSEDITLQPGDVLVALKSWI